MKALRALPLLIVAAYVFYVGVKTVRPPSAGNIEHISPDRLPWYAGGTLHRATMGEWTASTDHSRLATSADFIVTMVKDLPSSMEPLKPKAVQLEKCITKGGSPMGAEYLTVRKVAAGCAVLLGY